MNRYWKFSVLLAVITAGFFVGSVIAYDRPIAEDYRYQSWNTPDTGAITDRQYIRDAEKDVQISEYGQFNPVGAVFDVFRWIGESAGSVFGAETSYPYEAKPSP